MNLPFDNKSDNSEIINIREIIHFFSIKNIEYVDKVNNITSMIKHLKTRNNIKVLDYSLRIRADKYIYNDSIIDTKYMDIVKYNGVELIEDNEVNVYKSKYVELKQQYNDLSNKFRELENKLDELSYITPSSSSNSIAQIQNHLSSTPEKEANDIYMLALENENDKLNQRVYDLSQQQLISNIKLLTSNLKKTTYIIKRVDVVKKVEMLVPYEVVKETVREVPCNKQHINDHINIPYKYEKNSNIIFDDMDIDNNNILLNEDEVPKSFTFDGGLLDSSKLQFIIKRTKRKYVRRVPIQHIIPHSLSKKKYIR
jgi:hypothetical protein